MKKLLIGIFAVLLGGMMVTTPVMADKCTCSDGKQGVQTSILRGGCSCDDGKGSEIKYILELVVSIMTIGVGILGVLGITIVGVQYLTAGGSEEKTRKAKRRMFEIILGLMVYVLLFALLSWLIPDFKAFDW